MKRPQFLHRPAAWLLALAMALSLLPPLSLTAHAFTTYSLHIGNTQFTSENLTITDENGGTATFDPDTNTLTLTDFTYEGAGFRGTTIDDEAAVYSLLDNLTILLSGNNVLTHVTNADDAPAFSLGLYARGPVTVDVLPGAEYGRLVLNGGTSPNYSYGIKVDKSLTVNDGTLYATGGEAPYNTGIYTGYNLTVHDGMVLASCKAATTLSYGINTYAYDAENEAYNGGLYMNGGTVYAQTTEAPTCIAINSNHNITITDGFVSATGGTAEKGSCGMAASLISLQGGEVVTTGGTCPDGSYGIIAGDIFRMDGGKLTAKAGETELGYGIAAQNGIEISSGTVTAQGIGGAMTHAPMADSYDHFSFWYGADEASAMAAGVKPGSLIPDYCGKHYVHFTDSAGGSDPSTPPEPHVHENTVDFTWSADLSAASAKATCTTCGEEQTAEADLTWDNATPGRLQLTAGITLDGMTYTAVQTITAARTGNTLTLHLPGLIFAEQIIVAGYNEDGQMTECQISKDYSLTMTFTVTAPEVRVFFLDSSFDPQTPAMIV